MIAHGTAGLLKERLFDQSDKYDLVVCNKCGLFATYMFDQNMGCCKNCNYSVDLSRIQMPYACKLLFQELMAMCVLPRVK